MFFYLVVDHALRNLCIEVFEHAVDELALESVVCAVLVSLLELLANICLILVERVEIGYVNCKIVVKLGELGELDRVELALEYGGLACELCMTVILGGRSRLHRTRRLCYDRLPAPRSRG